VLDAGLSRQELLDLCELVSELSKVEADPHLTESMARLQPLLEFESAVVGSGPMSGAQIAKVSHLLSVNFSMEAIESYVGGGLFAQDPLVSLHVCQPEARSWQFDDIRNLDGQAGCAAFSAFRQCGARSLTMGWRWADRGPRAAYLCFSGTEVGTHPRHSALAEFVRPHIGMAVERLARGQESCGASDVLTARELEILAWIKDGKTSWEISVILSISERTVKFHVKNLLRKLDASTRAHAVAIGLTRGLIEL